METSAKPVRIARLLFEQNAFSIILTSSVYTTTIMPVCDRIIKTLYDLALESSLGLLLLHNLQHHLQCFAVFLLHLAIILIKLTLAAAVHLSRSMYSAI